MTHDEQGQFKVLPNLSPEHTRTCIVLTGNYYHDANFGGNTLPSVDEESYFVVKLGPSGEHVWSKQFGLGKTNFGGGPVTSKAPA